jgi:thioredoxin
VQTGIDLQRKASKEVPMKASTLGRRVFFAMLCAACFSTAPAAEQPYDAARFDAAVAGGGGVVIAFVVDWCSTCSLQKEVVAELLASPRFAGLDFFVADFDKERSLKRRLRVARQSTFIVFRGGREVARSIGDTDREALAALFAQAL